MHSGRVEIASTNSIRFLHIFRFRCLWAQERGEHDVLGILRWTKLSLHLEITQFCRVGANRQRESGWNESIVHGNSSFIRIRGHGSTVFGANGYSLIGNGHFPFYSFNPSLLVYFHRWKRRPISINRSIMTWSIQPLQSIEPGGQTPASIRTAPASNTEETLMDPFIIITIYDWLVD